jgi:hypothetical protein
VNECCPLGVETSVTKGTFGSATGSSQRIGEIKRKRGCEGVESKSEEEEAGSESE